MAKRLVRARAKIATAHIPYVIPTDAELPDRLTAVLAVVYLIATEAHSPTGGDSVARVDLEAEAIRLARLLVEFDARRAGGAGAPCASAVHDGADARPHRPGR